MHLKYEGNDYKNYDKRLKDLIPCQLFIYWRIHVIYWSISSKNIDFGCTIINTTGLSSVSSVCHPHWLRKWGQAFPSIIYPLVGDSAPWETSDVLMSLCLILALPSLRNEAYLANLAALSTSKCDQTELVFHSL